MDRRLTKTKKIIQNAFIQLLTIKSYEDITIKDIAENADITRKTFYYYYAGIYELVEDLKQETSKTIDDVLNTIDLKEDIYVPQILFEKVINVLTANMTISKLMAINGNHEFVYHYVDSILFDKLKNTLSNTMGFENDEQTIKIVVCYVINGLLSSYRYFNDNRNHISNQTYIKAMEKIVLGGLNSYLFINKR